MLSDTKKIGTLPYLCLLVTFVSLVLACLALIVVLARPTGATKQENTSTKIVASDSAEAARIVDMFKNGLRQASEKTGDDSALYGSMLVENALEQMVRCPAAVKDIWLAMTAHIEQAEPSLRHVQIELMLEYIDRALLACANQEDIRNLWRMRQIAVQTQTRIQEEITQGIETVLEKTLGELLALETALEAEKVKDTNIDRVTNFEPAEKGKTGPYQEILRKGLEIHQSLEEPEVAPWLEFIEDERFSNVGNRISTLLGEASRLQGIRYNLWANRLLYQQHKVEPATALVRLASIDTGLLLPSVYTLYSSEQGKLASIDDPVRRAQCVRKLLLTEKVDRTAF